MKTEHTEEPWIAYKTGTMSTVYGGPDVHNYTIEQLNNGQYVGNVAYIGEIAEPDSPKGRANARLVEKAPLLPECEAMIGGLLTALLLYPTDFPQDHQSTIDKARALLAKLKETG